MSETRNARTGVPQRDVYVALGSNLGDRWQFLRDAVAGLPDVVGVSSVYETEPVGGPVGQGSYLNMVAKLHTSLDAFVLLGIAQQLEQRAQRERVVRNGPRTLDVDLLWIDGEEIDDPQLVLPHPRMWERRFVLAPLGELAPQLLPDDWESRAVGEVWVAGTL